MAVLRLTDGGLFIWSPVALGDALRAELEAVGEVRHIVAPNSLHHLFLAGWRAQYPSATLHAAPGLASRRPDLAFDATLGESGQDWAADLDQVVVRGNRITTEVVFFHRKSATVLFTDLIQQFPPDWFGGWRGIVARLDLMTRPEPSVPRKFRLAFTDRRAGRQALRRIVAWPAERIVMAMAFPLNGRGRR